MRTSVVNGDVDAVVPWSPFRTAALLDLGDNGVEVSPGESLVLSAIGLGAVDGQLDANADVFKRMIEGVVEAAFLIRQDPASVAAVALGFIDGVSEEAVVEAIQRNSYDPRVSICTRYGVEATAQQLVDSGSIEAGSYTADDLIDTRVLEEVLAENPDWIADLPPLPTSLEGCDGFTG
jgi:ABC-type nitrate/sulfonate/bicarbonate transport system substrate-binding protein